MSNQYQPYQFNFHHGAKLCERKQFSIALKAFRVLGFVLFISLFFSQNCFGQKDGEETIYLDNLFRKTEHDKAMFVQQMKPKGNKKYDGEVYTKSDQLKMRGAYIKKEEKFVENGDFTFYYLNGSVESQGKYENGFKTGSWKRFTSDGTAKPDRYYDPKLAKVLQLKVAKKSTAKTEK